MPITYQVPLRGKSKMALQSTFTKYFFELSTPSMKEVDNRGEMGGGVNRKEEK